MKDTHVYVPLFFETKKAQNQASCLFVPKPVAQSGFVWHNANPQMECQLSQQNWNKILRGTFDLSTYEISQEQIMYYVIENKEKIN